MPDRSLFPLWSWVGQKNATAFENCLAQAYQFQVDQRHFSVFQAFVWAKDATDQLISIHDLSNQHSFTKIIPEQTKYIEIRSVMIRWQRKSNNNINDVWQAGENGWWHLDYLGILHLDPTYDEDVGPHANCRHSDCNHLKLRSGLAILPALDVKHVGVTIAVRAVWLVVKRTKDGTYRRAGIVVSRSVAKARSPIDRPSENLLQTITLG